MTHSAPRIAVVVSGFNPEVTGGLLRGALAELQEGGAPVAEGDLIDAPGAFELPLLAQALVRTGRYDGVVCLGCVIKGDTAHFEFISLSASVGLMQAGLSTETPITFGVLTTYDDDQALVRSRDDAANKGREAAAACLGAVAALRRIRAVA
ncbi:6,7-dimethyl-8-ribityllumazine synthase [Caulobacter sp. 602-2]|uniref:6,7-dimethyl-8-ribityllumazine synthase n=1 Tax=Caulobacter sp. 602-2 TaxID=2710887 RepID=A0A6G4QTM0_9CAUL|nr:6,7-dimethyl-8-ribityllumazine synthase [Caulobacter sp. 602-2]NGM48787.1 6,7-dimethyl-8-ribityllumazine synthase [Caulobacter sp. 602-2]